MNAAYLQTTSNGVYGQKGLHGLKDLVDMVRAIVHVLGGPGIVVVALAAHDGNTVNSHLVGLGERKG